MILRLAFWVALGVLAAGAARAQSTGGAPALVPMPPGMQLPPPRPATPPGAPPQPAATPPADWLPRQTADLQALDKVDDKRANLTVAVGQTGQFGHLTVTVRACMVRPPDQPADAASYLDIVDPRPNAPGFHGWMLSAEPAASMFEHPVYDVRLTGCH